jgi:EAL domain-containing protein (putative c-di-GMP-specific phosphodiesterase class I)
MSCDTVQGFTIARPMPAEDIAGWIGDRTFVTAGH